MNAQDFEVETALLDEHRKGIANAKRPGYTAASADVLTNFRRSAEVAGCTALQAWAVLAYKHFSAVLTFAKDPNIPQAEAIIGRVSDAMNYLDLFWGLVRDREKEVK